MSRVFGIIIVLCGLFTGLAIADPPAKAKPEELANDDGESAGMRSIAQNGHAVLFEAPDGARTVTGIKVFGARYGYPQPPKEDFHVWLCDENMEKLAEFDFPYSAFKRGEPKWVKLPLEATEVPEKFIVCVGFNPEQTKGVYVHHDREPSGHSFVALPGDSANKFDKGDWLIHAIMEPGKE